MDGDIYLFALVVERKLILPQKKMGLSFMGPTCGVGHQYLISRYIYLHRKIKIANVIFIGAIYLET